MRFLLLIACLIFVAAPQADELKLSDVLPQVPTLNSEIPTPESVVGIKVGERHWHHFEIIRYLDAVAAVSPRMVALGANGKSYGGRDIVNYAISSPENLARLDEIREARASIVDPAANPKLDDMPAVIYMMYSIHGNEPSGANATPLVAYYLAAAEDPALAAKLQDLVIIFHPMQNPDGLDRFAHWSNSLRGMTPSADPNDREHREASPNGRTNYYWFDLNRDWLAHQHPESRARLAMFHTWKPNVQLDFHEQGSNSNYFFMPGKPERTHPMTPRINQQLTARIGDYHAKVFDRDGIKYFTQERYDDFFMGKGSTYPDLFGSVGILYEQPSSRGSKQDTDNGLLTFPDSIANQFRTSLSSIDATADLRSELLTYQRSYFLDNAKNRERGHYLASAQGDPTRLREFVRILQGHDMTVDVLSRDLTVDGQVFKAGETIAIPLDQAHAPYLKAIWTEQLEFEENVFYDVSTWTMPWAFNLTHTRTPVRNAKTEPLDDSFLQSGTTLAESNIGYLIDWRDSSSPALLYALLDAEANVRVARRPMSAEILNAGVREFGYGTLFVSAAIGETLSGEVVTLLRDAATAGTPIYPVGSSLTPVGIDLGSREFEVLKKPKVLIATGPGTTSYNIGEIWHLLDTRVRMPLTMVDSNRIAGVDLGDYTHMILTDPLRNLSDKGLRKLAVFVEGGGVLWAQGAATVDWLKSNDMTSVIWRQTAAEKARRTLSDKMDGDNPDVGELEALLPPRRAFATAEDEAAFRLVRGAILAGNIDTSHPLGYGYSDDFLPMFRRSNRFMARSQNAYSTPILYNDAPLLSGYMSDENRELAAGSAGMIVDAKGEGAMVLTLDTPTFRAFWWGTQKLLVNAIFFGDLLEEPR